MGVSKNRGTPKWMVKIMENPIEMDDLGVPLFLETPIYFQLLNFSDFQVGQDILEDEFWFVLRVVGLSLTAYFQEAG